jgi:hypothetical protein
MITSQPVHPRQSHAGYASFGILMRTGNALLSADPVDLGAPSELIGAAEPMSIEAVLADRIARLGERC